MALVIITGDGPEHHFVTNRIVAAHDVKAIFVCDPAPARKWSAVLVRSPARFLDKALRRIFLRAIGDAASRRKSLRRVLGQDSEGFSRPDLVVRAGRPKDELLAQRITEISPRIIAVYGTSIVPSRVLSLASGIALNMHTGLSPWYRGTACTFWPIVEGDFERIGATVHECTDKVDGGKIFFCKKTQLYAEDDIHTIFARSVRTGTQGYVEVIRKALDGTLAGEDQNFDLGREYRGDMLGIGAEITARFQLRRAARNWPKERLMNPVGEAPPY